ncbi:DNA-binding response regulator, NarL/FixJ family, contains REC and HTH domains [Dyadobacter koreensis]|uniref:DNA-binding response regulator, NarL/FixJ family, contains REC and HTH domains n=1 Tax=Dyadobacter koreensis TaxID=408657 RepID=A0A1H7ATZ5_9BACT|nr:response regulator transcription factor [Dyadobacter koreensis]SEJ69111.1 DNA-binding response regulator, NarL/FixJ family, contains REC and HTH domains [Dyadobacter koreensis]
MTKIAILITNELLSLGVATTIKSTDSEANIVRVSSWEKLQAHLMLSSVDVLFIDGATCNAGDAADFKKIRSKYLNLKMILLAETGDNPLTLLFLKIGIEGVFPKSISENDFRHAYSTVLLGKKFLDPSVAEFLLTGLADHPRISKLTFRESQLANLLIKGLRTADIAKKLDIAVSTVSTTKLNIYKKMGVDNIVDLAAKISLHQNRNEPETAHPVN